MFDGLDIGQGNDTAALAERLEAGAEPMELLGTVEGPYVPPARPSLSKSRDEADHLSYAFVYLDVSLLYQCLDPYADECLAGRIKGVLSA